ncbi:MAG: gephyrin-like molybdotransferase Glp [Bacteroidota bacterium]
MISVRKAKKLVTEHARLLATEVIPPDRAAGRVLAEHVYSPLHLPPFDQSAMDGYAVKFDGNAVSFKVMAETAAGASFSGKLRSGQAVRIFTGAPVPGGADAVIMQEKVKVSGRVITVEEGALVRWANIRPAGSDLMKGALALRRGMMLNAAAAGLLASMGKKSVSVYAGPRVSILVTGNELQPAGTKLRPGKIYESNSVALLAALRRMGLSDVTCYGAPDKEERIRATLRKAARGSDMVLLTGGISVGDYDFAGAALKNIGVRTVFHKVRQKPGKPLFFGKKGAKLFFALPGNPASVLTCFYEYVFPALRKMSGHPDFFMDEVKAPSRSAYSKRAGMSHFLKGKLDAGVHILPGQESYKLGSFAGANCLVFLDEKTEQVRKGDFVKVHILP